jgi:hypothetical protein
MFHSSAIDYSDEKGLIDDEVVLECMVFNDSEPHRGRDR